MALDGKKTLMTPDVVIMPWGHSSGLTPLAKAGYHAVNAYGWYLNEKLGWERYFAFDFMDDVDPSLTAEQIGLIEGGAPSQHTRHNTYISVFRFLAALLSVSTTVCDMWCNLGEACQWTSNFDAGNAGQHLWPGGYITLARSVVSSCACIIDFLVHCWPPI